MESLLQSNADPELKKRDGDTALHCACYTDGEKQVQVVQRLLQHQVQVGVANKDGEVPLHIASMMGHPEVMSELLKAGAEIDRPRLSGETSLMLAAQADEVENLELLLREGANSQLRDSAGKTAFDWAVEEECKRCAELLKDL